MKLLAAAVAVVAVGVIIYKTQKEAKQVIAGATHEGVKAAAEQAVLRLLNSSNQPTK